MKTWFSFLLGCPEYIRGTLLTLVWFFVGTTCVFAAGAAGISDSVLIQIQALQGEKAARSPVEQKMDSQFVIAAKKGRDRVFANAVPSLQPEVRYEPDGRVLVDIDATVTIALLKQIEQVGGKVISSFAKFKAIRALLPLDQIAVVSASPDVKFVRPAVQAFTNTGGVNSQGDNTHTATTARSTFSVDGTGVKVGVLSDSVDFMANSQGNGNLGAVTVLSGQSGVPGSGEGTAMLEIIHDLAPGAQLFYATAFNGVAGFAQNILDLRAAGCDIIVDDVGYFNESPFQDGPIAQAVNTVTAAGALYFSAAANSGNKNDNTSGTWEGDFLDAGAAPAPVNGKGGRIHSFGASTQNTIGSQVGFGIVLFWSDPLGASANDYDLYILNSAGTAVVQGSSNTQNGSQDPYEQVGQPGTGQKVVIVKAAGAARYLHLDTLRGSLSISTAGNTKGHSAAAAAFSVAAVNAGTSYPNPFVGGAQNPIETFSSDGLRRVFYQADGTAITPGNFLSTGGAVRQKPDIAAADGVSTSVPGFGMFFGTSAAAPHAAAISALLLSYNSALTTAQVRSLLTSTALDIEAPGVDRDSGSGIVMALRALQAAPTPAPNLVFHSSAVSGGNGNNRVDPSECNQLVVTLRNAIGSSGGSATGVSAVLSTTTPGVTITQPSSVYPNVPGGGTAANVTPFQISTTAGLACGTVVDLALSVTTANAGNFTIPFQLSSGAAGSPIQFNSTDVPKALPDLSTVDSLLTVSGVTAAVARVTVTLYLTHTYDSDLRISLVGPDSATVLLSSANGAGGNDFGTSCSAATIFDDLAGTPISAGSAPFAGAFRPQQALALFNGKTGSGVNGTWRLRVNDTAPADVGTIQCWSINISPLTCIDGGGPCNNPPTVSITSPINNATFTAPANFAIDATAGDSDGTVTQVNFFAGTTLLGTDPASPYRFTWNNVAAGSYTLVAKATDNFGAVTDSSPINITVNPLANQFPAISITNPASGATFTAPANIIIKTTASDGDGTISKVELFNGNTLLGTDTAAPYDFSWNNVGAGSYTLTATVTDNSGAVTTSSPINITVNASGAQAAFVTGVTLGALRNDFNGWLGMKFTVGASPLNVTALARYVVSGNSGTHTVKLVNSSGGTDVPNGSVSIALSGATAGQFKFGVLANPITLSANTSYYLVSQEVPGGDRWAVETTTVTTSGVASCDGAILKPGGWLFRPPANTTFVPVNFMYGPPNQQPTVSLISPPDGALFVEPANITLTATANDSDGNVSKVEFFDSSVLLGTAFTSPYTIPWNNVLSGSYTLTAKATDNAYATTTSDPAIVVVDRPPTISITSPGDGAIFAASANIVIDATASDSDGSVAKVEFFNGATLLGTDTTSSYSFTWNNVGPGGYVITAKATDNFGAVTDSSPINITVNPNGSPGTFVTGVTLGALRNDFNGWLGMKFTVGASPLNVTALARYVVSGNSGTHTVKLVNSSGGTDVPNGSVSIALSGATAGQFKFGVLANPITLLANTSYYLVSQEIPGGDRWAVETTTVTTSGVASCDGAILKPGGWLFRPPANTTFVPVNFMYGPPN